MGEEAGLDLPGVPESPTKWGVAALGWFPHSWESIPNEGEPAGIPFLPRKWLARQGSGGHSSEPVCCFCSSQLQFLGLQKVPHDSQPRWLSCASQLKFNVEIIEAGCLVRLNAAWMSRSQCKVACLWNMLHN